MRHLIPVLASMVLVAACSGSAATLTAAPTAAPTPVPTPAPTAAPPAATQAPASPSAASGLVTYDGKTCTYTGPTVLPEGTTLQVKFAPAAETYALNWAPALHGTTLAQVKQDDGAKLGMDYPGSGFPAWALGTEAHSSFGSWTVPFDLRIYKTASGDYDGLALTCAKTTQSKTDPTAVNLVDLTTAVLITVMPQ